LEPLSAPLLSAYGSSGRSSPHPRPATALHDWFAEEFLLEEDMRKTRPPLNVEQQRALVQTRRTATLAALSLIRVGSTPQDLHERIRAAGVEAGLWLDAVERVRKIEASAVMSAARGEE